MEKHIPVLLDEILEIFAYPIEVFFDGTLGAGGHALALLSKHEEITTYYGCDRDPEALKIAKQRLEGFKQVIFDQRVFDEVEDLKSLDGALLDLGVSSMQLDEKERGFSFLKPGPLDMRMGPDALFDAKHVINTFDQKKLADLFYLYGEEHRSRAAAKVIVEARRKQKITTTTQLVEVLAKGGFVQRGKLHPATKIFQALRIYVNQELEKLEHGLEAIFEKLRPQGRLAVIAFHSLEDRIVKHFFREKKQQNMGKIITKKPISATKKEIQSNVRSRSAKLRVIEKQ